MAPMAMKNPSSSWWTFFFFFFLLHISCKMCGRTQSFFFLDFVLKFFWTSCYMNLRWSLDFHNKKTTHSCRVELTFNCALMRNWTHIQPPWLWRTWVIHNH
jgi:hypothetical protein